MTRKRASAVGLCGENDGTSQELFTQYEKRKKRQKKKKTAAGKRTLLAGGEGTSLLRGGEGFRGRGEGNQLAWLWGGHQIRKTSYKKGGDAKLLEGEGGEKIRDLEQTLIPSILGI